MFRSDVQIDDFCSIVETGNGSWVLCKRIPAMLLKAFDESHQPPPPPMREVEVLGGKKTMEECPGDPEHLLALEEFEEKRAQDFLNLALDFMVLLDESEVEAIHRTSLLARWGIEDTNQSRLECFALEEPEEDIRVLTEELMRLSTVTRKEVEAQEALFPGQVDGDGREEVEDAEVSPDGGLGQSVLVS